MIIPSYLFFKNGVMKKFLLLCLSLSPFAFYSQSIDSVTVTVGNPESSVHIQGFIPQMELASVTVTSSGDAQNTQVIDLRFKGCPLTQVIIPYDTVVQLSVPFPFGIKVNAFHDTSAACPYPSSPMLTDTFALTSSAILGLHGPSEDNNDGIVLFPNPAGDKLEIYATFSVAQVSLYASSGKKLTEKKPGKKKFALDLDGLPAGEYFIVLTDNSGKAVTRQFIRSN